MAELNNREVILSVKDLKVNFRAYGGLVQAVRGISFDLYRGETLAIVGESGSGKSVTSKAIMGILANNAIVESGSIMYEGENLIEVSEDEFHRIRGKKIGFIFQQFKIADRNLPHTAFAYLAGGHDLQSRLQFAFQMILIEPHQYSIAISTAYIHS